MRGRVGVTLLIALTSLPGCSEKKKRDPSSRQGVRGERPGAGRCQAPRLRWPLAGRAGTDWVINNYVDLDGAAAAARDYTGATGSTAKTYDGHFGVDIDIASFRQMDAGTPVVAAAAGTVIGLDDGHADRNTRCVGEWNYVRVRHPGGHVLTYGHLAKDSVVVSRGQSIAPGTVLAAVGSSGCSTQPHLHFEVHDCEGAVVSPFATQLWNAPPTYNAPLQLMDVMLREGGHAGIASLKDPPPNPARVTPGATMGFGVSASGGREGDTIGFTIRTRGGRLVAAPSHQMTGSHRHSYWYWNQRVPRESGALQVQVQINGEAVWTRSLDLRPASW